MISGKLIVSRCIVESITADAGCFGHVGLCQLHFVYSWQRPTWPKCPDSVFAKRREEYLSNRDDCRTTSLKKIMCHSQKVSKAGVPVLSAPLWGLQFQYVNELNFTTTSVPSTAQLRSSKTCLTFSQLICRIFFDFSFSTTISHLLQTIYRPTYAVCGRY